MSLCLSELDALGLGGSRVGKLGRLRSPHAPQSSNLSRIFETRNLTVRNGEQTLVGPDIIQQAEEQVCIVRDNLKAAQSHQKSNYDQKHWVQLINLVIKLICVSVL